MADDKSIGEIGRSVDRIERALEDLRAEVRTRSHELSEKMQTGIAPVSLLVQRMTVVEVNLDRTMRTLARVEVRSAAIAGGVAVIAFLAQFLARWVFAGH